MMAHGRPPGHGTGIEWTHAPRRKGESWNPVRAGTQPIATPEGRVYARAGWHCEHVSEGCRNCYAEGINRRLGTGLDFKPGHRGDIDIFLDEKLLTDPLRWQKPRSVFLSSMTDIFADFVSDEMLDRIFAVMALAPQHYFLVLTKRPERMRAYIESGCSDPDRDGSMPLHSARMRAWWHMCSEGEQGSKTRFAGIPERPLWPLQNVGLGVSVEDQAAADQRIPHLLATPAGTRFVSAEPLLGPVDLRDMCNGHYFFNALTGARWHDAEGGAHDMNGERLDWVIAGGESGDGARPMHPDWLRSLRDQCAQAETAFFFKQWGEWLPWEPEHGPCWKSQSGRSEDHHALFPADWDNQTKWDDGLWAVNAGETQAAFERVGKKAAGAMLDGREHREFPPALAATGKDAS
ncbi:phage Gp37/Gp68 family protein [Parvibaculum sp.]|uniref:phage Gp37/Gp68 family protein n=1 Tax=Parvibaculum sp. TaxID=2024848 RepID=UPI00261B2F36|nr:phage Gp37/Gp68 family protein [Parvibaculum sp.]MCW5727231.1 phage Gp37/Gp68 family protein [Parvibaculum sp.]